MDLALMQADITSVCLYETLGEESFEYIVKETNLTALCCSVENLSTIFKYKRAGKLSILKSIVCFDSVSASANEMAKELALDIFEFSSLVSLGKNLQLSLKHATRSSLYTLAYTSGTTSLPKGVMISQENAVAKSTVWMDNGYQFSENDTHLSYLRLVHILERSLLMISYTYGVKVGFAQGDL